MKIQCPGKIILSGEHAVVYQKPALAVAVNRYATAEILPYPEQNVTLQFQQQEWLTIPLVEIASRARAIESRYQQYLKQEITWDDYNLTPTELFLYTIHTFYTSTETPLRNGLEIQLTSEIPVGAGMGSSAALCLALLEALNQHTEALLNKDQLYALAIQSESLQHGTSSGLDPLTCLYGGVQQFKHMKMDRVQGEGFPFHLVFTGTPQSSTAECVFHVRKLVGKQTALWDQFEFTTEYITDCWIRGDQEQAIEAVKKNQDLLSTIEVVPDETHAFISHIVRRGGAAKICGAGAIRGDQGGMLLVLCNKNIAPICEEFGYTLFENIQVDYEGLRKVHR